MSFLKNIDHGKYDPDKIRYVNFNCVNPNVKKKEYVEDKSLSITNDRLSFIDMHYGKNKMIYLTTPIMTCPFGVSKKYGFTINLQFTNIENDPHMKSFYDFIKMIEYTQMKHIGLSDDNKDIYLSQIRRDKDQKYDPNLVVKLPFSQNRFSVEYKNKEGDRLDILNIPRFSKLQCDIYIDKIWKYNDQYVCKWKAKKIRIM